MATKTKLEIDPHQWRSLATISHNARGVLSYLMSFACENQYYGIVQSDGVNLSLDTLVRTLPGTDESTISGITELTEKKIIQYVAEEPDYFIIPFMIRAHEIRKKRQESGKLGGNPTLTGKEVVSVKSTSSKPTETEEYYLTAKKRKLTGAQLGAFRAFWSVYNYPKGKASAADSWLDLHVTKEMFTKIIKGAKREADARPGLIDQGKTPIFAQGFLSQRRFEDEI